MILMMLIKKIKNSIKNLTVEKEKIKSHIKILQKSLLGLKIQHANERSELEAACST